MDIFLVEQFLSKSPKNREEFVTSRQSKGVIKSRANVTDSQIHPRNLHCKAEIRNILIKNIEPITI